MHLNFFCLLITIVISVSNSVSFDYTEFDFNNSDIIVKPLNVISELDSFYASDIIVESFNNQQSSNLNSYNYNNFTDSRIDDLFDHNVDQINLFKAIGRLFKFMIILQMF